MSERPPATDSVTMVVDARTGAALLLADEPAGGAIPVGRSKPGRTSAFRWTGTEWTRTRVGLLPSPAEGKAFSGRPFGWFDAALADVVVGQAAPGRIGLVRLAKPDATVILACAELSKWVGDERHAVFDVHRGTAFVHVNFVSGEPPEGATFRISMEAVERIADGPPLMAMAYDARRRRIVGHAFRRDSPRICSDLFELDGASWRLVEQPDAVLTGLAWDPKRERLLTLAWDEDGGGTLFSREDSGLRPAVPAVRVERLRSLARLGIDPAHDQILCFGGQSLEPPERLSDETVCCSAAG